MSRDAPDCNDDELRAIVDGPTDPVDVETADGTRRLLSTCAADVTPEPVRWLWADRLPFGKLVVVDGDPGTSKTTLLLDIAARLSTGGHMPDGQPIDAPGAVLYCSAEDGAADTLVPRLIAAGADLRRVHLLTGIDDGGTWSPLSLPEHAAVIGDKARDEGAQLIVIDPLAAFLSGRMNRDEDMRRALHPLARIAEDTGAAVVIIRHLNKGGSGGGALYRGGGSIGIVGAARLAWTVAIDPDDQSEDRNARRRVVAVSKSNVGRIPTALSYTLSVADVSTITGVATVARVQWGGPTTHTADDLVRPTVPATGPTATERAERAILEALADGPRSANDLEAAVCEGAGIGGDSYKRARARLRDAGRIAGGHNGFQGPYMWRITPPPHHNTLEENENLSVRSSVVIPFPPPSYSPDDWLDTPAPAYRIDGPAVQSEPPTPSHGAIDL